MCVHTKDEFYTILKLSIKIVKMNFSFVKMNTFFCMQSKYGVVGFINAAKISFEKSSRYVNFVSIKLYKLSHAVLL